MTTYDKNEYLQTPRGRYGRYIWRQLKGRSIYSLNEEPRSKNSMRRHQKIEFQKKLLDEMKASKKRAYRSPIIAEMSFKTTTKNPPHIQTVVKNYLDLFEAPLDNTSSRKGLVYQDDKKIYGLSVRYNFGDGDPEIMVSFVPFRNFLMDLDLASDIISGVYSEYMECYDFEEQLSEIQGNRKYDDYDSVDRLRQFVRDKEEFISVVGEDAYNAMLPLYKFSAQEHLLKGLELGVNDLILFYRPLIMKQKFAHKQLPSKNELEKIPQRTSDWIANSPIRIKLPNAPLEHGDTKIFKQKVRASLAAFHQEHRFFKRLHIPVNLNILYKPPRTSKTDYNDLDNIMRKIVPAFNEIFEPPSTIVSHVKLDSISDGRHYRSLKKMQEKIPKSIRTSISGYDIFKMPREPQDDSEGYLTASFSSGTSSHRSPMLIIDSVIEKWIECCKG
jgi:Holliday junction resolvase RusA-like endonuclease